jgi:dihydrofolate synthase / folylpolyglutamate synthase
VTVRTHPGPLPASSSPKRTLPEWLEYISSQHPTEIALGLDRVRAVWERMGSPRAPVNIIVGGTNGKGSTCAMLERILHSAGYRTGCYTSPHLIDYNERVRLLLESASDEALCAAFEAVEAARGEIPLTYFEYGTLGALKIFADAKLDVAVLEVGLGGRLDAVNIVDADCSIVVSVDLDHQSFLGNTREAIAFEKAGVYRNDRPAIYGETDPPHTLTDHAAAIGARLLVMGRDFGFTRLEQQWQFEGPRGKHHSLPFPALRGPYQLKNASVVLAALDELRERLPVSQGQIRRGLLEVELPGRLQVMPGRPAVVLDVAHNPHAARVLEDALGTMGFYENTFAVFGMLKDKDIESVIDILKGRIDKWYVATLPSERAATAGQLAEMLAARGFDEAKGKVKRYSGIATALEAAQAEAGQNDRILVFGSFFTVADALQALKRSRVRRATKA